MSVQRIKSHKKKFKGNQKDKKRFLEENDTYNISYPSSKKDFFNVYEFENAFKYIKIDPCKAKEKLEEYLNNYPLDVSAMTYYASVLMCLNDFDSAEIVNEKSKEAFKKENVFLVDQDKRRIVTHNIVRNSIKILIHKHQYREAIKYYYDHYNEFVDMGPEIIFYLKGKSGLLDISRRTPNSYLFRQIVEYREDDFRDHIKKHLADVNENDKEISTTFFHSEFPFEKALEEAKKHIPGKCRYNLGFYEDIYVFRYDDCGRDSDKRTNYFKVVTFEDSDHLITMCPSNDCENLPSIDLNYLKEETLEKENNANKVKRMSQIDKFNRRYGMRD